MAEEDIGFVHSVYIGREDARGPSLGVGNILNLKEQRNVPKEERIIEASRKIRKGDPADEFFSTWRSIDIGFTETHRDETFAYRVSAQYLPHFRNLNMKMLAAAWMVYFSLKDDNFNELTPKKLREITTNAIFISNLRTHLVPKAKTETVFESDLSLEKIEWDLIRYTNILLNFRPDEK